MKINYFLIMIVLGFCSCKKEKTEINHPPVANAGNDITIELPSNTINLDGSRSTDPDNNITGYLWSKISGPSSNITNTNVAQTQVSNFIEGIYKFELKVTDAGGLFSKDTMQVTVNQLTNISSVDVYVAGKEYNGSNWVAKYWKNGQAISITDGTKWTEASYITVAGSDVYLIVVEYNITVPYWKANYWKNGQEITLTDGTKDALSSSIAVVGSDVYVSGSENNGSNWVAKYWKNGQAITLTDGSKTTHTTSIAVVGSDVYVAGKEFNGTVWVAKYWKNGQTIALTDGTKDANTTSIAVVGSDVYVAGSEHSGSNWVAKYWKNGQAISLTDGTNGSEATSITVSNNDVYVAGFGGSGNALYWKNGQQIALTDGNASYTSSIAVVDSDVHVAGNVWIGSVEHAKYWKNGNAVILGDVSKQSKANSIFLAKK